jgi:hypothetical protein
MFTVPESGRVYAGEIMRRGTWLQFAMGGLLAFGMMAGLSFAQQQIISAQSGTVQYIEGTVYANGQRVERKFGQFPTLRQGEELRTEDGRTEVLLTPGAFLRVSDHSSVRMVSNRLPDTRVEVLSGSVMVECDELLKDNAVSLVYQGDNIQLEKHGLYRLDTAPAEFRVYEGEAVIQSASGETQIKPGKKASLSGVLAAQRFDRKLDMDDFYQWSSQRSSNLAYASVTASQSVLNAGTPWHTGGWMWSSLLDEYTYLPGAGLLYSPFGWGFWSPIYMGYYYTPVYYGGGAPNAGKTGFATGQTGRTGPGTVGGAATNPRSGFTRPVPSLSARAGSMPGASYGGVAAVGVGARSTPSGGFRSAGGGFSGGSSASGLGSGSGGSSNGSGGGFSSGSGGGGFHGGGFSGGGHAGGGRR